MSFRGRGRGRDRVRQAKPVPFELFPEIEGLGKTENSSANIQLIKLSSNLQKYWNSSPFFYEDRSELVEKVQKIDIERYSERNPQSTEAKPPLWHFIKLDTDHVPAELASRGEKNEKHVVKRVRWSPESDSKKMDLFEKLDQMYQGQERMEKKENENEEEDDVENEDDEGEFSDEGDYEHPQYVDDDEDDYNMADDQHELKYY
ncbi:hypothetical protein ACJIZ3_019569 [Penstemon smallii]|uniref:DNA-directed RNA polymerase III subunit n=1 Tax=Penstemon smallii TaxID=265156 RepID=A0ABD3T326_9LAMI